MRHLARALAVGVALLPSGLYGVEESLAGLKKVGVVIGRVEPELSAAGITKNQIRTDVELRLRKAGVRVEPGVAYLTVDISALRSKDGLWSVAIAVGLDQMVTLARDTSISVSASTWKDGLIVTLGESHLQEIRQDVGDLVDKFLNAHLEANPPPIGR